LDDLVILGAGGFAREVAFLVEQINAHRPRWRLLGFVEREQDRVGTQVGKYVVHCTEDELLQRSVHAAIGIGDPDVIARIAARFAGRANVSFPSLVHPGTVADMDRVRFGRGNVVCAGNVFTTDISIGDFNIFNLSCTYGHDVQVGSYCVFNPGVNVSGGVEVGDGCMVGTGAKILQYTRLGAGCIVGAGAVVTREVPPGQTVVGVPAKPVARA
jgi:sugar O-acyltransferase (sialic acid O-acetyltransferase NeuD family)